MLLNFRVRQELGEILAAPEHRRCLVPREDEADMNVGMGGKCVLNHVSFSYFFSLLRQNTLQSR